LIQRGVKIKAGKKSATCAASPRKSSKLAPSLRSVAQTAKIFVRSDPAPVEPPISSRPVVAGSVGEAERPGTGRFSGRLIGWPGTNARALSPFSRGRRIPAFAGTGRKRGWKSSLHRAPFPFFPSPGERLGGERRALRSRGPAESAVTIPKRLCPQPNESRSTTHDSRPTPRHPASERSERTILHPLFSILHSPAKATHR
jgi:hypothetical protein